MTNERALPTPPRTPAYAPSSATKRDPDLKPNPHPYAIKTTSTALLTRSNSSGHNTSAARHYYVPLSPNPNRHGFSKGHKSSKSMTSAVQPAERSAPRPLPAPPSFPSPAPSGGARGGYVSADEAPIPPRRTRRADTLPVIPTGDSVTHHAVTLDDLPSNPKMWTPTQLASYLVSALRVSPHSGSDSDLPALPAPVAMDIATFMKQASISGRTFLRMTEEEFEALGMNNKWRGALLAASRNLRQNVIKGRIWGPETSPPSTPGSSSPLPVHLFASASYNSSSSSVDLSEPEGESGINEAHGRARRNGRVRGMVETFERSGSFSSEGSFDEVSDERFSLRRWLNAEGPVDEEPLRSPSPTGRALAQPLQSEKSDIAVTDDEPTVEMLLAQSEAADPRVRGSWGARAWEELDLAPGVTVKRIAEEMAHDTSADPDDDTGIRTVLGPGSTRRSGPGSGGRRGGDERRVVTAIFTPDGLDATRTAREEPSQDAASIAPDKGGVERRALTVSPVEADLTKLEQILEDELVTTRAVLDQFRHRLETVEMKVAQLEEVDARRSAASVSQPARVDAHAQCAIPPMPAAVSEPNASSSRSRDEREPEGGAQQCSAVSTFLAHASTFLPEALQQFRPGYTPAAQGGGATASNADTSDVDEPANMSDLPSYMLLVGIGVCAVVLRVVLRKVASRSAFPSWRA
ncbi:hypothetical protein CERSUDRAFT_117987 [Gelatoporia subvermispora B]|uniref:SAM domain-containing protein n=1 Tax=Ceriporiopsis subvermispora (strain B) TaxID=914234 RepID=M2PCG6_CERS8|nr:hypothetical protein CERSUDRAFT_117987 [Gelatoporia subvermispora B]